MNCFFATNHLSAYLEKSLPYAHVKELENHLIQCGSCKKHYNELQKSLEILKEMPTVDLNSHIRCEVRNALLKSKKNKRWFQHFFRVTKFVAWLTGFVFVFVILGTAVPEFLLGNWPTPPKVSKRVPPSDPEITSIPRESGAPVGPQLDPASNANLEKAVSLSPTIVPPLEEKPATQEVPITVSKKIVAIAPEDSVPVAPGISSRASRQKPIEAEQVSESEMAAVDSEVVAVELREVSLWLKTPTLSKTEKSILKKCKKLQCRGFQGDPSVIFQDREEKRMVTFQLPAKNLPPLRNHLSKWGRLSGAEDFVPQGALPEEDIRVTLGLEFFKPSEKKPALEEGDPEESSAVNAETGKPPSEDEKIGTEDRNLDPSKDFER